MEVLMIFGNDIYDREAPRIVNSIPGWDVIYRHGEIIRAPWMISLTFKPYERRIG